MFGWRNGIWEILVLLGVVKKRLKNVGEGGIIRMLFFVWL